MGQGWKQHVPPTIFKKNSRQNETWSRVVRKIQSWCYSWMRRGYEDELQEYKISKYLLLRFLFSQAVFEASGHNSSLIQHVFDFLRGHVFVHENLYLYYLRKRVRHYFVSHGSPHEVNIVKIPHMSMFLINSLF